MAARFASSFAANRCSFAVACSSARIIPNLDTALLLAVSICVVCRIILPAAA